MLCSLHRPQQGLPALPVPPEGPSRMSQRRPRIPLAPTRRGAHRPPRSRPWSHARRALRPFLHLLPRSSMWP